jgi:hypothetical protein
VLAAVLFLGLKLLSYLSLALVWKISVSLFSLFSVLETVLSVFVTVAHPAPSFYM